MTDVKYTLIAEVDGDIVYEYSAEDTASLEEIALSRAEYAVERKIKEDEDE